jgi:hypothetical protein
MADEKGRQHHFLDEPDIIFLDEPSVIVVWKKKTPPQKS